MYIGIFNFGSVKTSILFRKSLLYQEYCIFLSLKFYIFFILFVILI